MVKNNNKATLKQKYFIYSLASQVGYDKPIDYRNITLIQASYLIKKLLNMKYGRKWK